MPRTPKDGESKPPILPPFPIEKTAALRDRLFAALSRHVGSSPEGERFADLCQELAFAVETGPSDPAVAETVRSLPCEPLTKGSLRIFCWRVAARIRDLRRGIPVRPWSVGPRPEWMAFEVMGGEFHRSKKGSPGYAYRCRVIGGSACPEVATVFWTWGQVARVTREVGFSRRGRKKRPYSHPKQLVRMRFAAQVVPDRSERGPGFDLATLRVPAKFKKHNVEVLKRRVRREPPCPMDFMHECHRCPIGYAVGVRTCPAAVHPATWLLRECGGCGGENWFDPEARSTVCVDCTPRSE